MNEIENSLNYSFELFLFCRCKLHNTTPQVTLLLMNAIAAESLPLALDRLGLPHWATIMISVLGVLIFGEILPSSIFTGPKQLEIASFFVPFVSLLQTLLGVLVIPIARLLDAVLGKEHKGRYTSHTHFTLSCACTAFGWPIMARPNTLKACTVYTRKQKRLIEIDYVNTT